MTTISCIRCKAPKEESDFHKQSHNKSGIKQPCKSCRHEKEYLPRAEKMKNDARQRYADDVDYKQQKKDQAAQAYIEDPEGQKVRSRKSTLKRYFQMTPESYAAMSAAQDHKCSICKRTASEADAHRKDLCVDHDHSCCPGNTSCGDCIRGLICSTCNTALGYFQDSIERMKSAIKYVASFKPKICVVA